MKYKGELYGKVGSKYFPLIETTEDIDELKQQRDQLIRVLQDFISSGEVVDDEYFSMEIDQAKELINKIKENE